MDNLDRLTSLPKNLPTSFLLFSTTFFLSSPPPEASPSRPIYLLPLLHGYSSHVTFVGVNTSGYHRNTFAWPHLHFASPPLAMVASRVTFTSVNNEGHGRVSSHGLVFGHGRISRLQPRSHVASPIMVSSLSWCICLLLDCVWFSPFFPFTFLLESGFKSLFFFFFFKFYDFWDLLWLFNKYICSLFFP